MSDKMLFTEMDTRLLETEFRETMAELSSRPEQFDKEQGMRVLIAWDAPEQGDLIHLYLTARNLHEVVIARDAPELRELMEQETWDILLLSLSFPDEATSFDLFQELQQLQPECPVVGACDQHDVIRVPHFLTNGMRTWVIRDAGGDFIFLLQAMLQDTVESVRAERERLLAQRLLLEVESVRNLQTSIIPRHIESPANYEILGRYEPSQIRVVGGRPVTLAGGDYYDAIMLDEEHLIVLIGDASGHGMRACLSIVVMHTLIRLVRDQCFFNPHANAELSCALDPARFLEAVNRHLCDSTIIQEEGGFITLLYGILNTNTHEFVWASAGHNPPLLQGLEDGEIEPIGTQEMGGMPLCVQPESTYDNYVTFVPAASRLLLYTDGLLEAFDEGSQARHAEFGLPGIHLSLEETRCRPLTETLDALLSDSNSFTNGTGRHDDTSIVLIERLE